jgi:dolichol-phosphate mannosyltransferase
MNLHILMPALNEEKNIRSAIHELVSAVSALSDVGELRITVVDDHSSDATFDIVQGIQDERVSCIRLSRQSGSHVALRAALKESVGDVVLCISADGQDDPSCIAQMLHKWSSGAHIIWALREDRSEEYWFSCLTAQMFYRVLVWLTHAGTADIDLSRADFFLLDTKVVNAINDCPERNTSLFGLIAWLGFKQDFVIYKRRKRLHGSSKWSFRKRMRLAKDWIVAFSGLPLKMMTHVGIWVALMGFAYSVYIAVNFSIGEPIQGWSSTMVVILVLGGMQMIMFGIVGEYLWRNLDESRRRPLYFIERESAHSVDRNS